MTNFPILVERHGVSNRAVFYHKYDTMRLLFYRKEMRTLVWIIQRSIAFTCCLQWLQLLDRTKTIGIEPMLALSETRPQRQGWFTFVHPPLDKTHYNECLPELTHHHSFRLHKLIRLWIISIQNIVDVFNLFEAKSLFWWTQIKLLNGWTLNYQLGLSWIRLD